MAFLHEAPAEVTHLLHKVGGQSALKIQDSFTCIWHLSVLPQGLPLHRSVWGFFMALWSQGGLSYKRPRLPRKHSKASFWASEKLGTYGLKTIIFATFFFKLKQGQLIFKDRNKDSTPG